MMRYSPRNVSEIILEIARMIPVEGITLRQLLALLGEQGFLVFCIFLTIPFVLPIQIPGSSTFLGLPIAMVALGITTNRVPRFPQWLMERQITSTQLNPVLKHGARFFAKIEQWVCPRWFALSENTLVKRVTGLLLLLAASLLALPLFIPFSNVLPALAILLLTVGILECDGLVIVIGYVVTLGTALYFVTVTLVAIHSLHTVIGISVQ
jgi:hypothetical protein